MKNELLLKNIMLMLNINSIPIDRFNKILSEINQMNEKELDELVKWAVSINVRDTYNKHPDWLLERIMNDRINNKRWKD